MSDTLTVEKRTQTGSRESQRLRAAGKLPAVLYGHGDSVSLVASLDEVRSVLRHSGKIVDLKGAESGQALVQATQWDTFGSRLLHLDLLRVRKGEMLEVEVEVELKGDAIGANEGGVVEQVVRKVTVAAPPSKLPEKLHIDVTELHLGAAMQASDITDLPEGAKLVTGGDTMIVHCVPPAGEPELTADSGAGGEPEVIGGKSEEGDAES